MDRIKVENTFRTVLIGIETEDRIDACNELEIGIFFFIIFLPISLARFVIKVYSYVVIFHKELSIRINSETFVKLTANGLSYGKSLDDNGQYTKLSHKPINRDLSRRVEIRIVTSGDDMLIDFVEKNEKANNNGK